MSGYELNGSEQAVVRVVWHEQIARDVDGLNLTEDLRASGRPW